jgi:pyruvate,orthophosphate dikinase
MTMEAAVELAEQLPRFGCRGPSPRHFGPDQVGNKAANLIRMSEVGLPVPAGFVLPTSFCREYFRRGGALPDHFSELLHRNIQEIEQATGLSFAGLRRPLLVSVRSGAAVSMPGMMDTILNIGLCDPTVSALIRMTGNPRHAWDSYRRLIHTYTEVVHGRPGDRFEGLLNEVLRAEAVPVPGELDVAALQRLTQQSLAIYEELVGEPFPQDPLVQLREAVEAVMASWESPRATEFRRLHHLDHLAGTAVTVQAMVFGNMGGSSGSGVAFSRDPASGERRLYLDFAWNAPGEDVVSGRLAVRDFEVLKRAMPGVYGELRRVGRQLEELFRDAQDFEFTVQEGRLYLLQSRDGKRTPWAALRIACDLVKEGLIDEAVALQRLAMYDLQAIQSVHLAADNACQPLGEGIPASPGVAVGRIALDAPSAVAMAADGRPAILVRTDIATSDISGLAASAGMLTARGGRTSHAAVVARQLNKVCIVGCHDLFIPEGNQRCRLGQTWLAPGDALSLDGHSGRVYEGELDVVVSRPSEYLAEVERWKARQPNGQ